MINLTDFPKDIQDKIEKILVSNEDYLFYGSINDPHIIFRGDIDIMQVIKRKDSRKSILREVKDLFRQILKIRDGSYYISEIKMGEDESIRDEVERLLKNKNKVNKKNINEFLERMKADGRDVSKIQKILNQKMSEENYYNLVDEMRSLYVYRWTARDVVDGKADFTLANNELVCKYDVQIWTGFRYLEMSNYIQFPDLQKKKDDNDEEFLKSLRKNIVKQYYSDKNYYKTAKRLLTYYKQKGDDKMVEKIYELINNPVLGNLYILKTACSVLMTVLEFAKKIDMNKIRLNIESLKMNTIYLDEKDKAMYNRELDKMYKIKQRPALEKRIEALKNKFDEQLQEETDKWANEINFDLAKIVKSFVEN